MPKELCGCEGGGGFVGPRFALYIVGGTDCMGQQTDLVYITSRLKK